MPQISIIIPVYNSEKYLEKCLESMFNQTFKDIEVICINDGSTDNSLKILEEYKIKDSRIKVINNKNQGQGLSRQCGLNNVDPNSKYLMFCDSDDWYEPDMCEKMYNAIEQQNVDIVMCDTLITREVGYINIERLRNCIANRKLNNIGYQDLKLNIMDHISTLLFNKIYKIDLIKKYSITFPDAAIGDDNCFVVQYLLICNTYYGINKRLYNYLFRENSIVDNCTQIPVPESLLNCVKLLISFIDKNNLYNLNNEKYIEKNILAIFFFNYFQLDKKQKLYMFAELKKYLDSTNLKVSSDTLLHKIQSGKFYEIMSEKENKFYLSYFQNLFSIKNYDKHKIITISGVKFKIKQNTNYAKKTKVKSYCPICQKWNYFLPMSVKYTRNNAICPNCKSLERHRFLQFVYKFYFLNTAKNIKLLQIAPEIGIYNLIKSNTNIDYTAIDLHPEFYKFAKECIKGDVIDMPFADKTFDVIIHNQVMEHVADEKRFIDECMRVLKDEGIMIVNIPYDPYLETTIEDKSINTDEDRFKHYHQKDHVRLYGRNFLDNFSHLYTYTISEEVMTTYLIDLMKLKREFNDLADAYFIVKKY